MKPWLRKTLAVLEALCITFGVVPLFTLGVYRLWPRFESWQTETLGFPFPVFVQVVMAAIPILLMLARRERLADYGLTFRHPHYHLDITATCFIPFALAGMPLGLGVDHTRWGGALLLAAVRIALLFILARLLRRKPSGASMGLLGALALFAPARGGVGQAAATFCTYALFVGFGEEILYRGYIHTRLSAVFGKPYAFYDVHFGWGGIIAALIFGLTHVGILRWILGASTTVTLAWGFWTFFGGLVFGYVREKSGSILAPALLHGLPQAIASVVMLLL